VKLSKTVEVIMTEHNDVNNRRSRRAFFTFEDNIGTSAHLSGNFDESIPVTLLSISNGGVSFTGNRFKFDSIIEGDVITLKKIQTPEPLGPIDKIDALVKYVVKDDYSVRIVLGCEFTNMSKTWLVKIGDFVDGRLKEMGLTI
jgi:hypothetical protein